MGLLGFIFGQTANTIGGIVIDATVEETHTATADVTENAVEDGAKITDHVQVNPDELVIQGIVTDTPFGFPIIGNIQNIISSVTTLFGGTSHSTDAFNRLTKLKDDREPFVVYTGLKRYKDMVITELVVNRNAQTGKALNFRCTLRNIRIVSSQTGSSASLKGGPNINSIAGKAAGKGTRTNVGNIASKTQDVGKRVTKTVKPTTGRASPSGGGSVARDWFGGFF